MANMERDIEKLLIHKKEGQYGLEYEGEAGYAASSKDHGVRNVTMQFSFEDCEFHVELIRDGDLDLR